MNLHQLYLFCNIVETGSIKQASELLYISQPALSIQLKRLEVSLGLQLFERVGSKLFLTEAGEIVYKSASSMLNHKHMLENQIQNFKKGFSGNLRIGTTHTGAFYLTCEIIQEFNKQFPDFTTTLSIDNVSKIYSLLLEGIIDIALEWHPVRIENLATIPLCSVEFNVLVSPQHALSKYKIISNDLFCDTTFVTLRGGFIEALLREKGFIPKKIITLPSIDAIKKVVEAGVGITVLSQISVKRETKHEYLKTVALEKFRLSRTVCLLSRRNKKLENVTDHFIKFARHYLGSDARCK